MSGKTDTNFKTFLTGKFIDLSGSVFTDSFKAIGRWNIISRIFHRDELNSENLCENIKDKITDLIKKNNGNAKGILGGEWETEVAILNLNALRTMFNKAANAGKNVDKNLRCVDTIDNIFKKISPKQKQSPQAPHVNQPPVGIDMGRRDHGRRKASVSSPSAKRKPKTIKTKIAPPSISTSAPIPPRVLPKAPDQNKTAQVKKPTTASSSSIPQHKSRGPNTRVPLSEQIQYKRTGLNSSPLNVSINGDGVK